MANANGQNNKCHLLISLSPELRQKFKAWCSEQGISMNSATTALMETTVSKKRYKIQQRVIELSK